MESTNKRYSGRFFTAQEIKQIRELIHTPPQLNRQQLSYRVCELFDWRKADARSKRAFGSRMLCRLSVKKFAKSVWSATTFICQ